MVTSAEFHALDQASQVAALELLGRDALGQFGIVATAISPLVHGENTTFCVESSEGKFNLRISRPGYMSTANIRSEIRLLGALRDADFHVPDPWQDRLVTASHPSVPEPRDCVLLGWLDGEIYKGDARMSRDEAFGLGQLMARLHDFLRTWPIPPDFDRHELHAWAGDRQRARAFDNPVPGLSEELRRYYKELEEQGRDLLLTLPRTPESFGLIHADLHGGNVLFLPGQINVIDFDDSGWAFYLYDFAAALAYEARREDYPAIRDALLEGYSSVAPLPPSTEELLVRFIKLRICGVIEWMLSRIDNPDLRENGPIYAARAAAQMQAWPD